MSEYIIKGETLTGIADAIRSKDGTTEPIPAGSMAQRIIDIPTGNPAVEAMLAGLVDGTATKVVLPENMTSIRNYAFYNNTKLSSFVAEGVTTCGTYAFYGCAYVDTILMPNVTTISSYAINGCRFLKTVDLSRVKTISSYSFQGCTSLKIVDLPVVTTIQSAAFSGCSGLATVIIRRTDAIAEMANVSALNGTKIRTGTGYIYVPAALLDTYKAATNWSTYAAQFRVLEEYTVDGTVNGELDESKI